LRRGLCLVWAGLAGVTFTLGIFGQWWWVVVITLAFLANVVIYQLTKEKSKGRGGLLDL
jgi:hypothetical protein